MSDPFLHEYFMFPKLDKLYKVLEVCHKSERVRVQVHRKKGLRNEYMIWGNNIYVWIRDSRHFFIPISEKDYLEIKEYMENSHVR